ncbi:MAG: hypothetical protein ACYC49_12760 [Ignavibacteriaceae bacterium]
MENIYEALIKGNKLDWIDLPPKEALENKKIKVKIMLSWEPKRKSGQGELMSNILKKLADAGGLKSIKNPVTWQRNTRKDRSLNR